MDYLHFYSLLRFWVKVNESLGVENNIFLYHCSNQEKMKVEVQFKTSPLGEINWPLPSDSRRMDNKARESQKVSPCKDSSFSGFRRIYGSVCCQCFLFWVVTSPCYLQTFIKVCFRVTAWTKRSFVELREKPALFGAKNYRHTKGGLRKQVTR